MSRVFFKIRSIAAEELILTQKHIFSDFHVRAVRHDLSLSKFPKRTHSPLEILKNGIFPGGCLLLFRALAETNHDDSSVV